MKRKYLQAYMNTALAFASLSEATRRKVGCVIVNNGGIVAEGLNGTPSGYPTNVCEEDGVTCNHVVHAEMNALAKAARRGNSVEGATVICTLSPCETCASILASAGISEYIFMDMYRCTSGIRVLLDSNVDVYGYHYEVDMVHRVTRDDQSEYGLYFESVKYGD